VKTDGHCWWHVNEDTTRLTASHGSFLSTLISSLSVDKRRLSSTHVRMLIIYSLYHENKSDESFEHEERMRKPYKVSSLVRIVIMVMKWTFTC
jgi:hypothetical protein